MNRHPDLHFPVTEGGVDERGIFHKIPRIEDSRLAYFFAREVLADLARRELPAPNMQDAFSPGGDLGANVHSRVRAKIKAEGERVGKYMMRPLFSLERLSLDEQTSKLFCPYGKEAVHK